MAREVVLIRDEDVAVTADAVVLTGRLTIPQDACGVVVFAHGSASSRHSPRNWFVAAILHQAGFATLVFDLLTPEEERSRAGVFDTELLTGRLVTVTEWLTSRPDVGTLPIGYFGASTGAALAAAADPRTHVKAVVSRGGRPDLAGPALSRVTAPTLLIVGGRDTAVLELNRQAQAKIGGRCDISVIPGATHLFEEHGALVQVADLACAWFVDHVACEVEQPASPQG